MKANAIELELVFILDRSGSMGGLESDTIGGFNSMLTKQQTEPGECRITTVLFDNKYEVLHDRINIKAASQITEKEYFARGSTALLDAIGKTINKIDNVQKSTSEDYRAKKVLFVITTDGMENASCEFSYSKIKSLIEQQESEHGWEFLFLGANIDAVDVANRFGIAKSHAQNYHNDSAGVQLNYDVLSKAIKSKMRNPRVHINWNAEIEADYTQRKSGQ